MDIRRKKVEVARWHLLQQEQRIQEHQAFVAQLERSGDSRKAAEARELLTRMKEFSDRLYREVPELRW